MLTKCLASTLRKKRTAKRVLSPEGLALKNLRQSQGYSMRKLGELIGKSDSYISHIENGRLDFPKASDLDQILNVLGGMKQKSFFERARKCRTRVVQEAQISTWIKSATDEEIGAFFDLIFSEESAKTQFSLSSF